MKTILFLIFFWSFNQHLGAAVINKFTSKSVEINPEGKTLRKGQRFFLVDAQGKRRAIIRIQKVGQAKALARILKGKAAYGQTLVAIKPLPTKRLDIYLLSLFNVADIPRDGGDSETFRGSSYGGGIAYQYGKGKAYTYNALARIIQVDIHDTSNAFVCDNKTKQTCNAEFTFAGIGSDVRFEKVLKTFSFWAGMELLALVPMRQTSTLNDKKFSFAASAGIFAGARWNLSRNYSIPLFIGQNRYLGTPTKLSTTMIGLGLGYHF